MEKIPLDNNFWGLVSIIVPMHNVSNYIERLVKSVLKQKYYNWELLLIDDNSLDNTLEKLKYIKNKQIKIIKNLGNGVSAARNTGLKYAKGKYICFVDADDEINDEYVKKLVEIIKREKVEIVLSNYYENMLSSQKIVMLPWKGLYSNKQLKLEIIPKLIYPKQNEKTAWMPVWRTIISKDFLKKSNILFDENIRQAEDFDFMLRLFLSANKVYFSEEANYIYYRTKGSSMNKYIPNFLKMQLYIHNKLINTLKSAQIFNSVKERYYSNKLSMYSIAISNSVRNPNKKERIREIERIRSEFMNDKAISIQRSYNTYQIKFSLILLRLNLIKILYTIYVVKEKLRLSKLNS